MKILRPLIMLLLVLAVTSVAVAQPAGPPTITPGQMAIQALRLLICPGATGTSCGDIWNSYLPTQAANGANLIFTAPIQARLPGGVEILLNGVHQHTAAEVNGNFLPQVTITAAAGVTTATFNAAAYIPQVTDQIVIRATQ